MTGACDNCGSPDEELGSVVRIYLVPDDAGGEPRVTEVSGTEEWCPACRATYPHRAPV